MKSRVLDGLIKHLDILPLALNEISESASDTRIKSVASGYDRRIHEHNFLFSLIICHKIFEKTDCLRKIRLQDPKVVSGEGVKLCQVTSASIQKIRNDDTFEDVWKQSL